MRNPAKAILVAILIAIPAPFVLGLLLSATPAPLKLLAMGEGVEALGSQGGIAAYLMAFAVFAIVGFIAVLVAGKQAAPAAPARTQNRPARASQPQNDYDDEDDFDDNTPEGDEEGTVKWFNVKKGFGFIVRESGDEIFVHFRAIRGRGRRVLRQGQLVRFNVVDADKGLQADNVSILSD
ncbi:cold-shock protein [Marinobacter sp. MDS2]|uniref:cold-shock protein n=1 Tax=Marinobacter sp. MDS2 TaxID=3065961 RepID=UPI00273CA839|nr:cold shock domain-containing protein [Marinobacter sp. MDS2]MDP4546808.1 cold shock domain-containing protein [Marinobacter sp. MDS2]